MEYSVIKEGELFLTTEKNGDIRGEKSYGLYTKDTRFLSAFELTLNGRAPSLLSSNDDKNYTASMRLVETEEDVGSTEVHRERFIHEGILYERMTVTNYFLEKREATVRVRFDADFQDMFIVRGYKSGDVGEKTGITYEDQSMKIGYVGKDGLTRETFIEWNGTASVEAGEVKVVWQLEPQEKHSITFAIQPVINGDRKEALDFDQAFAHLESSYDEWLAKGTRVESDHPAFDEVYRRGALDTRMLMSDVGFGSMPVAGVPWFCVPFGRDSLITSLFMLPYRPDQIKGTLRTLAHYQGREERVERDEQPGKIMHELRFGELTTTGQVPFSPYYGTVDATPLYVILATEYYKWTGDLAFLEELKPVIEKAFHWIDTYGSLNDERFIQYAKTTEESFINQGWKDSDNSNVHQDGTLAEDPIALVEVQGYVYQAKVQAAEVYRKLGDTDRAEELVAEAETLRDQFEAAFWMEDEKFYALALDGKGAQVKALTSNPGHVLMSGLMNENRASEVSDTLTADGLFSGYGIRTLSDQSVGYYPMSYHNGSVWPHDNGMILLGLAKTGQRGAVVKVVDGLLEAAGHFEHLRLPELFCGYSKGEEQLVPYPTTCSPQAWAATTSFILLQAMLGIQPDAGEKQIQLAPMFPSGMNQLKVTGMSVGDGKVSLMIRRNEDRYEVEILENTSGWDLVH